MKLLILLLFPIFINAQYVSPKLIPAVRLWEKEMGRKINNIDSIILIEDTLIAVGEDTIPTAIGWCVDEKCKIYVANVNLFYSYDVSLYYKLLVFHELGHYYYNLSHKLYGLEIMNPSLYDLRYYKNYWNYVLINYKKQINETRIKNRTKGIRTSKTNIRKSNKRKTSSRSDVLGIIGNKI